MRVPNIVERLRRSEPLNDERTARGRLWSMDQPHFEIRITQYVLSAWKENCTQNHYIYSDKLCIQPRNTKLKRIMQAILKFSLLMTFNSELLSILNCRNRFLIEYTITVPHRKCCQFSPK